MLTELTTVAVYLIIPRLFYPFLLNNFKQVFYNEKNLPAQQNQAC